jgi:hypothetical protein
MVVKFLRKDRGKDGKFGSRKDRKSGRPKVGKTALIVREIAGIRDIIGTPVPIPLSRSVLTIRN